MKKLTETETAVVKAFHLVPEDWQVYESKPLRDFDYAAIAAFCIDNGYPDAHDILSAGSLLSRIENKFWDEDGFDETDLEDVAVWVLTTYFDKDEVSAMSDDEVIKVLQDWKYYYGFRKHESLGASYRSLALQAFDGALKLRAGKDIFYE